MTERVCEVVSRVPRKSHKPIAGAISHFIAWSALRRSRYFFVGSRTDTPSCDSLERSGSSRADSAALGLTNRARGDYLSLMTDAIKNPTHAVLDIPMAYIKRQTSNAGDASHDRLHVELPGRLTYASAVQVGERDGRPELRLDPVGQAEEFQLRALQPVGTSYREDEAVEPHYPKDTLHQLDFRAVSEFTDYAVKHALSTFYGMFGGGAANVHMQDCSVQVSLRAYFRLVEGGGSAW